MSFLDNVPEQNVFVLSNGAKIHNLEELLNVISSSEESLFYNHVTSDRNDFANWIKYVIYHEDLYNKLINIKDRKQFINILGMEIDFIRTPKLKETAAFFSENPDSETVSVTSQPKVETPTQVSPNVAENVSNINPNKSQVEPVPTTPATTASTAASNSVPASNPVQGDASNSAADMFKPVPDTPPSKNPDSSQNISLASSESTESANSGMSFSDFEQVLSVIIAEINTEIFSD